MGKKIRLTILLLFVFVIGGVAGHVFAHVMWMRNAMGPFYARSLTGIAIDAQLLSKDRADEVFKLKVALMPPLTQSYREIFFKFMPDNNSRYNPLWQVQRYYEISEDEIPSEIKPILESLPKRPLTGCELKRLKEAESLTQQESE